MKFSTKHTLDTQNPQDYWQHFRVAFFGSLKLMVYAVAGIIHAFLPEIKAFQFYTSSGIIRAYRSLELSKRHDSEIEHIFSKTRREYVEQNRGE